MSRMAELAMEIELAIEDGELTYGQIADKFNVPVEWVYEVADRMAGVEPDPGDMDGDEVSGLASAGWGTDEDYGYYGEDDY